MLWKVDLLLSNLKLWDISSFINLILNQALQGQLWDKWKNVRTHNASTMQWALGTKLGMLPHVRMLRLVWKILILLWNTLSFSCSDHSYLKSLLLKSQLSEELNILISLNAFIISQYIGISNHQIVHHKYIQLLTVKYTSIKTKISYL